MPPYIPPTRDPYGNFCLGGTFEQFFRDSPGLCLPYDADPYGVNTMPNGFLPTAGRDSLLGNIFGAIAGTLGTFVQGPVLPPLIPGTGIPDVPIPAGTNQGGMVVYGPGTKPSTTKRKCVRIVRQADGSLATVKCKRRMSPCNPHAARRAVRRLGMVHSFMQSIEKSMHKACPPKRISRPRGGRCNTCRKNPCGC